MAVRRWGRLAHIQIAFDSIIESRAGSCAEKRTVTTKNMKPHKKDKHLRASMSPPFWSGQLVSKPFVSSAFVIFVVLSSEIVLNESQTHSP